MKFISLNKRSPSVTYEDAIFLGIAPDGGLYVPEQIPHFTKNELEEIPHLSLHEIATLTLHKWLGDELDKDEISEIVKAAISFPLPLVEVGGYKVFELFHAPTLSFKDIPTRILAHTLKMYKKKRHCKQINILLATNDDTGAAITNSFAGMEETQVVVLFPKKGFEKVRKDFLTRVGNNVLAIEVDGNYEQCQQLVSATLHDEDLHGVELVSGNSISIGRLIPQIIYYVYLYSLMYPNNPTLVIPADNLGNACTALLARLMGIPFQKIVLAANEGNFLLHFTTKGSELNLGEVLTKRRNIFDKQIPKNFPRIMHWCQYSHKRFMELFEVHETPLNKTSHLIHAIWHEHNYLIDPNTARAWLVADTLDNKDRYIVIGAIASPIKYVEHIKEYAGITVDDSAMTKELNTKKTRAITIPNDYAVLKSLLIREFEMFRSTSL